MDLLALLVVLGVCSSLALGNYVKPTPPEDLDGSGDDEDFSGSGMESFLEELDFKSSDVSPTSVAPLDPTVIQMSTAQKPDIAVEEETREENVTQHTYTTKPHDPIEEIFDFEQRFAEEGTTFKPTTDQTSTVESGSDVKKHHHHPTTLPVTSVPAPFEVDEEATTSLAEVEKPFVAHEETTTSTPDEGDMVDLVQEVTSTPEDSVQHVHPETTSGLTSTPYAENEETTAGPADVDEIPVFVEMTTVTDDSRIHKHHHPHHHSTTSTAENPFDGSDIIETTDKSDFLDPEDQDHQDAITTPSTTPPSEDEHHHDHKHHKHHHHTTTPEVTQSTVPEQVIVHTHEPKGRRVNVPPVEVTTAVPVLSEDDEPVGSTTQYNHSVILTQDEDNLDSAEVESGDESLTIDDIFFEQATVPLDHSNRNAPVPGGGDGSTDASHGIMERKELLAGIIAGGLAGLVFAASLVAFVFYRMKKKDEGSYSLEEPKQSNGGYQKPREQREFYA